MWKNYFLPHIVFCCNNRKTSLHTHVEDLWRCNISSIHLSSPNKPPFLCRHPKHLCHLKSVSVLVSAQKIVGWRCWQVLTLLWDVCVCVCGGPSFQNLKTLLELFCRQIVQMNRRRLMGFTVRKWRRCSSSPFLSPLIHMEAHCSLRPDSATIAALCILQKFVVTLLRVFGKPRCLSPLMSACVTG